MRAGKVYWWGWLFIGLWGLTITTRAAEVDREPLTAVLGAMPDEVHLLESRLQGKQVAEHLGLKFFSGKLAGRPVVVAYTGIGKVNAAMTTTLVLDHYHPTEVLFTGVAGGINTNLGPAISSSARGLPNTTLEKSQIKTFRRTRRRIQSLANPIRYFLPGPTGCWPSLSPPPKPSPGRN